MKIESMKRVSIVDTYCQKNAVSILVRHDPFKKSIVNSCRDVSHMCDSNERQKPANACHWQEPARRSILAACSMLFACPTLGVLAMDTGKNVHGLIGPEIPQYISDYFKQAVEKIRQDVGQEFNAGLVIFGVSPRAILPNGIPGDPAKDYSRRSICGTYVPPGTLGSEPYERCLMSDDGRLEYSESERSLTRDCCRHFAYCVPYDRFPVQTRDMFSTVVLSSRVLRLSEENWKAIIAHELGHAIDFHIFGNRYRLKNRLTSFSSSNLESAVVRVDSEQDPEVRADKLAEIFLLHPLRLKLCYDPETTIQVIQSDSQTCETKHYSHSPIQGRRVL